MPSLVTDNFRVFAAEQFIESLAEPFSDASNTQEADNSAKAQAYRSKIYLFTGRPQNWTLERYSGVSGVSELAPPTPNDSFDDMNEIYDDMIAMKRVSSTDVSKVIKRNTWKTGLKYDMFKNNYTPSNLSVNGQSKLYDAQFYVINSNYQVYKCIFNGESPTNPTGKVSTVEPTGTTTSIFDTSDGYRWLYLYTINISDYIKFVSSDFIPVKTDNAVKTAAAARDGAIEQLLVTASGSSISPGTYYCPILGDNDTGTASNKAIATIVVPNTGSNSGKIDSATLHQIGKGYTRATVLLTAGYATAAAAIARSGSTTSLSGTVQAIISPPGGHGADTSLELGGYRVMINKSLEFLDGSGDIPVDSQFRRYGLISDPVVAGATTDLIDPTVTACKAIKFASSTSDTYTAGEIITQATTGAKGRVIHWDTVNKVLRYYQNEYIDQTQTGTNTYQEVAFTGANAITGATSNTVLTPDTGYAGSGNASGILSTRWIAGYASSEVKKHSGTVIYTENRKAVNRSNDQIEDIKLVVEF